MQIDSGTNVNASIGLNFDLEGRVDAIANIESEKKSPIQVLRKEIT